MEHIIFNKFKIKMKLFIFRIICYLKNSINFGNFSQIKFQTDNNVFLFRNNYIC
jgi:hypothetical protein